MTVDYAKVDAALASALEDVDDPEAPVLSVFVHVDEEPSDDQRRALAELGIGEPTAGVCTATVSARQVAALSDTSGVRHLRLSQRLRPLNS